jgi:hypothetical protein
MLKRLFKGYVVVETIFGIGFIVFLLFVLCMVVYYRQLYDNPLHLFIAVIVGIALLFVLYRTIRHLISLKWIRWRVGKKGAMMFRVLFCCVLVLLSWSATARSQSPYVGQEFREIKALSPQEISDYLSGKGLGLAKAAELKWLPKPGTRA